MRTLAAAAFLIVVGLFFANAALLIADLLIRPADGSRLVVTLMVAALYAAPGLLLAGIGLNLNALLAHDTTEAPARHRPLLNRLALLLSMGAISLALILVISISAILQRMGQGVEVFG